MSKICRKNMQNVRKMKKNSPTVIHNQFKQAVRRCYTPDLDSGIPDEIVHGRKMHYVHVVATVT